MAYTQVYYQLTAQYIVLMLLHIDITWGRGGRGANAPPIFFYLIIVFVATELKRGK
jgi:hypothetical protein